MKNEYLPVGHDFLEIIGEEKKKEISSLIHYFGGNNELEDSKGEIKEILSEKDGDFLAMNTGDKVRLDRIITINGKPGPAFGEYDSYANDCMDCT